MAIIALVSLSTLTTLAAEPTIMVSARQRYPWNGLVDVHFTITGDAGTKYDTSFTAKDMVGNTNIAMRTIRKSDGTAAASKEQLLPGTYNWVWDAAADLTVDRITHDGFLTTSSTTLFTNRSLSTAKDFSIIFGGASITVSEMTNGNAYNIKTDGNGKSIQFQIINGGYLKCLCVHVEQSGNDIIGYVKWARYMAETFPLGTDFDSTSYTAYSIATSSGVTGYGVSSITATFPNLRHDVRFDRVTVTGTAVECQCYLVKFNANGGTGSMPQQNFIIGTSQPLTGNAFSKSKYAFFGWSKSTTAVRAYTDKQTVVNLTTTPDETINLYAIWTMTSLANGLNCTSLPWRTGDSNAWRYWTKESRDGVASVMSSGAGGGAADSWMETTIKGPATISFYYAKKHYSSTFTIKRGSTTIFTDSSGTGDGVSSWIYKSFSIPSGTYNIRFNYHHSGEGYASGGNGIRIDQFKVTYN